MSKPDTFPSPDDDDFALLAHQWTQITAGLRALWQETKSGIYYLLTSRTFQKSVLSSVLVVTASVVLYLFAAVGYVGFYYAYLPRLVHEEEVFLQYGYGQNPLALTPITLLPSQPYDISVSLTLPLTPSNTKRGNFMVVVHLLDTDLTSTAGAEAQSGLYNPLILRDKNTGQTDLVTSLTLADLLKDSTVLFTSARPAIIPYTDPLVSLAKRILFLPYHVLFTQRAEATTLTTKMVERVAFGGRERSWMATTIKAGGKGGGTVPRSMVVEIQAGQGLQVYECKISLVAQLRGLRWLMYRWRILSFIAVTTLVWGVEMGMVGVAVVVIGGWLSSGGGGDNEKTQQQQQQQIEEDWEPQQHQQVARREIKEEEEGMSDTERTFPTGRGEMSLRYESSFGVDTKGVKKEEEEQGGGDDGGLGIFLRRIPDFGEQGDDDDDEEEEEEEEDGNGDGNGDGDGDGEGSGWRDSGVGTSASYSDTVKGGEGGGPRRRRRVSRP